jgi:hypothetical protein
MNRSNTKSGYRFLETSQGAPILKLPSTQVPRVPSCLLRGSGKPPAKWSRCSCPVHSPPGSKWNTPWTLGHQETASIGIYDIYQMMTNYVYIYIYIYNHIHIHILILILIHMLCTLSWIILLEFLNPTCIYIQYICSGWILGPAIWPPIRTPLPRLWAAKSTTNRKDTILMSSTIQSLSLSDSLSLSVHIYIYIYTYIYHKSCVPKITQIMWNNTHLQSSAQHFHLLFSLRCPKKSPHFWFLVDKSG